MFCGLMTTYVTLIVGRGLGLRTVSRFGIEGYGEGGGRQKIGKLRYVIFERTLIKIKSRCSSEIFCCQKIPKSFWTLQQYNFKYFALSQAFVIL